MSKPKQRIIIPLFFICSFFLLFAFAGAQQAQAANDGMLRVGWTAPTLNEGSTAPLTDLAGFIVYYGTAPQAADSCPVLTYNVASPYDSYINIGDTAAVSQIVSGLTEGHTYYFTVVAYDDDHNLSSCATDNSTPAETEVSKFDSYRGDFNYDGSVNLNDYNSLVANYGNSSCGNEADGNRNCLVNLQDYSVLVEDYGKTPLTIP